ncbi:hypothetical protein FH039_02195 [Thermococcus indicus]|uniref:Uncharacterized protein n=1 Tax=Thermococcus indicus TaxID=2586643 RepID=A0A4Y5SKT1_9EURY|nr:hypothetical protein [Thermococcus indicus]QDA30661.1 hypothetical protein FH039_02195 [Thermococcus indicus]
MIVILSVILMVLSVSLGANCIGSFHRYENSNRVYLAKSIQTYYIPANSHVEGYIKADGNFSAYVMTKSELKKYKHGKGFKPIISWINVSYVELELDTLDETCYLVVRNEEEHIMLIHVEFEAK